MGRPGIRRTVASGRATAAQAASTLRRALRHRRVDFNAAHSFMANKSLRKRAKIAAAFSSCLPSWRITALGISSCAANIAPSGLPEEQHCAGRCAGPSCCVVSYSVLVGVHASHLFPPGYSWVVEGTRPVLVRRQPDDVVGHAGRSSIDLPATAWACSPAARTAGTARRAATAPCHRCRGLDQRPADIRAASPSPSHHRA